MKILYCGATGGFYLGELSGDAVGKKAVEITAEQHRALLDGEAEGKIIKPDRKGSPRLHDRPEPSPEDQALAVQLARAQAYRLESDPLFMEWQYDETEEKKQAWRASVEAIKARYPLP